MDSLPDHHLAPPCFLSAHGDGQPWPDTTVLGANSRQGANSVPCSFCATAATASGPVSSSISLRPPSARHQVDEARQLSDQLLNKLTALIVCGRVAWSLTTIVLPSYFRSVKRGCEPLLHPVVGNL